MISLQSNLKMTVIQSMIPIEVHHQTHCLYTPLAPTVSTRHWLCVYLYMYVLTFCMFVVDKQLLLVSPTQTYTCYIHKYISARASAAKSQINVTLYIRIFIILLLFEK